MDIETLKKDLKALSISKTFEDGIVDIAIQKAGKDLAWHLDIPELQVSHTITVVSGTAEYDAKFVNSQGIDRITSAVFVGGTNIRQPLDEVDIRTFDASYYGYATTGTPYQFAFFKDQIWLYYIPNISGTVYLRLQKIFTDFINLRENYYPLVFALTKRNLMEEKSPEYNILDMEANRLMSSFKGRVRPYKAGMELSAHRAYRMYGLNNL